MNVPGKSILSFLPLLSALHHHRFSMVQQDGRAPRRSPGDGGIPRGLQIFGKKIKGLPFLKKQLLQNLEEGRGRNVKASLLVGTHKQ